MRKYLILLLIVGAAAPYAYYNYYLPNYVAEQQRQGLGIGESVQPKISQGTQSVYSNASFSRQPNPANVGHSTNPSARVASNPFVIPARNIAGNPGMPPGAMNGQTIVLPGDANGPDLSSAPFEFLPVVNLEEIIRFDVLPNWVKSRWDRVSTTRDYGLHGLRVPLVTGTNSWDLHGSMTYYFDANQRVQRISFRGWTGDASKLVNLLTQKYGYRAQPTHWAGLYSAEKGRGRLVGVLLMQHPTIIKADNPLQQMALVMELNNPNGQFVLSDEIRSLLPAATSLR